MSEVTEEPSKQRASMLIRGAIWIAIGALIAAALVCVVWVLIGDQNGIIGRAFLTILLLAGFAGIAILEAGLASRRPDWLALASMITWIVALIAGAIKIWLPTGYYEYAGGVGRFFMLLVIIGVLQLALLHVRLFTPAAQRYVTTFTTVIYYVTIAMLVLLVAMLVIYLTLPDTFFYSDLYWRIVVALAILTAVGTMLIPLLNALFAPKKHPVERAQMPIQGYAPIPEYGSSAEYGSAPAIAAPAIAAPATQQWPTYADGFTPLPVLADGSPDWNAYYTGVPTPTAPVQSYYTPEATFPVVPEQPATPEQPVVPEQPAAPEQPVVPEQPVAPTDEPAPAAEPAPPTQAAPGSFPPPPPPAPRP